MSDFPSAFSLEGETALITGGGTGLGLGIARCMSKVGAKVVLVGRRENELRTAAEEIGARYIVQDITSLAEAPALIERAAPVSILVNNAGIHLKKAALHTTTDELEAVMKTHVTAAHALTAAALPGMIERGSGSILFTASMASLFGVPMVMAYSAAKSAMLGIVRTLSTEVASQGIRVNAIAPGWIDSPMLAQALASDPARRERILQRTPMARFGDPEDVGWAAVYLCSPAAKFLTGVVLPVDGGASIGF